MSITIDLPLNGYVFERGEPLADVDVDEFGDWSFTTDTLLPGEHRFRVRATDAAGNTSEESDELVLIIDTVLPDAPVFVSFSTDTGLVGDGLTADATPELTGTAEAGSDVFIQRGGVEVGQVVADLLGDWSFVSEVLSDTAYDFTATATDAAGNISPASQVLTLVIDASSPDAPVFTAFSDDSGQPGDGVTNDRSLMLVGTTEPGSTVVVSEGNEPLGLATVEGATWQFEATPAADGPHAFGATATDAAGNASELSEVLTVVLDTTPPEAPVILALEDDTGVAGDGLTNLSIPRLSGTGEAGTRVELFEGETSLGSAGALEGSFSIATARLADGLHELTATATDDAGNAGPSSAPFTVAIDTAGPTLVLTSASEVLLGGATVAVTLTFSEAPQDFTLADVVAVGGTVADLQPTEVPTMFTVLFTHAGVSPGVTVNDGAYADAAGNPGKGASLAFVLDTDGDGIVDSSDDCPAIANPLQEDLDGDKTGDLCDADVDGDGLENDLEQAIGTDPRKGDTDADGLSDGWEFGDGLEARNTDGDDLIDALDPDSDADDIADAIERGDGSVPLDSDDDKVPDVIDTDSDNDTVGDQVEGVVDTDGDKTPDYRDTDSDDDGVKDDIDNCRLVKNTDQPDADDDRIGDACDGDLDGDGVPDSSDNCPGIANADQADADGDATGDACETDGGDGGGDGDGDGDGGTKKADGGCGCSGTMLPGLAALAGVLARRRRRTGSVKSAA